MDKQRKPIIKVQTLPASRNNFIINEDVSFAASKSAPDIHTSFQTFVNLWVKFNGGGSLFLQELCTLLSTTVPCPFMPSSSLAAVSLESHAALLQTVQELDSLLLKYRNNRGSNSKLLISCILHYVKLQSQYHAACLDALNTYVQQLSQKCQELNRSDISKQLVKLNLVTPPTVVTPPSVTPTSITPTTPSQLKSKSHKIPNDKNQNHPNIIPTHTENVNPKSFIKNENQVTPSQSNTNVQDSTFSLFSHKNDDSKSRFYTQTHNPPTQPHNPPTQIASKPRSNHQSKSKPQEKRGSGLVSDTDLDNVINLLSGVGSESEGCLQTPTPSMEPHFVLPNNYFSLPTVTVSDQSQVPNHNIYSIPPVSTNQQGPYSFFWSPPNVLGEQIPYLPSHFPSPCTMPAIMQTVPPGFDPSTYGFDPSTHGFDPMTPKSEKDGHMNQTWTAPSGGLTVKTGWPVGADSDDLSDDSSTGEPYHSHNRDSSHPQEESEYDSDERLFGAALNQRPRSMENLVDADKRTCWQTQHDMLAMSNHEANTHQHRPLQMYYSDPMSASNIWSHPDNTQIVPDRNKPNS